MILLGRLLKEVKLVYWFFTQNYVSSFYVYVFMFMAYSEQKK